MKDDFPLECSCGICDKYVFCPNMDGDLNARICPECLPHLKFANQMIIDDLTKCGLLQ